MRWVELINIKMQNIFLKYRKSMHSSASLFDKYLYLCYFVIQLKLIYYNLSLCKKYYQCSIYFIQ